MRPFLAGSCLVAALLAPTPFTAQALAADPDPATALDAFKQAHAKVVELVDGDAKREAIQHEVDALLDYEWIAQATLGGPKHYAERCAERCPEFEALLTELIRSQYLRRLADHERGSIEYLGEQVREQATKVDTRVSFQRKGKTEVLTVDYVMHQVDGHWQVRDIITEDVSLTKNYKYEIHKIYKRGGIEDVLATLQAKLDG